MLSSDVKVQAQGASVAVVLVNYNTGFLLEEVLSKLKVALAGIDNQIFIIDNNSKDDSVDLIKRKFPELHLIANTQNVGFGRANNQALPFVTSDYVLLLNTDAFVRQDTLTKTLAYMEENPRVGVLGVRLEGRDGELQASARYFPTPWNAFVHRSGLRRLLFWGRMVDDPNWDSSKITSCDWVPGCYYLVRKAVIDKVGLFDPRYFLYFEEVDHCFATKQAGWEVVCYPHTTVIHIGGESAKSDGALTQSGRQLSALQIESEMLYFRKNHGLLALFWDVFLMFVSDAVGALRWICRRPGRPAIKDLWRHLSLVCSLLIRTGVGAKPTR